MTNTNQPTHDQKKALTSVDCVSQQGAGSARLAAVALPAPCGPGQFAEAAQAATAPIRILRLPEVINRVGLRRASIYSYMAIGAFPQQVVLGPRAVGWLESEIDAWLATKIKARQPVKA
jgi:prophage regulatory protein